MQTQSPPKDKPYFFQKLKTYTAEEIIATGGTTAFGLVSNYDPQELYQLTGEPLSEEEYQRALKQVGR
jgi:hypothetical protein